MIRSDIFPRFAISIGRIKKGFGSWDKYAAKTNSHKRRIPAQVETDFIKTIEALVPENIIIKNVEISVLSINDIVSKGEWTNDVQTAVMVSGNPFIIQYSVDGLQIVFFEELMMKFSDDQLTALFIHDVMYVLLTTMTDNRLKRMMMEFFSAVKQISPEEISWAMTMLSVYVATTQFRNPYIDSVGVTGIDDTIISILMPSEIEHYNAAVTLINPTHDIVPAIRAGMIDRAKELAVDMVNRQMENDLFTARIYSSYKESGSLKMYFDMLNPILNVRVNVMTSPRLLNEATASMTDQGRSGSSGSAVNRKVQEASWDVNELMGNLTAKQVKQVAQIRYDIDKLAVLVSTIEDEDERLNALYKAKVLNNDIQKLYVRTTGAADTQENYKMNLYLRALDKSVTELRERIISMKISPKKYGVFMELPAGYSV